MRACVGECLVLYECVRVLGVLDVGFCVGCLCVKCVLVRVFCGVLCVRFKYYEVQDFGFYVTDVYV